MVIKQHSLHIYSTHVLHVCLEHPVNAHTAQGYVRRKANVEAAVQGTVFTCVHCVQLRIIQANKQALYVVQTNRHCKHLSFTLHLCAKNVVLNSKVTSLCTALYCWKLLDMPRWS